eukprot:6492633-Amphidinium_carterae.2
MSNDCASRQSYVNAVPAGITPMDWLEQHASVLHLVLPVTEVESVKSLEEGQLIVKCKQELKAILASSSLGFRLFSGLARTWRVVLWRLMLTQCLKG